jgi:translocator protein
VSASDRRRAEIEFYRRQRLPPFAPPAWAFPVAWTINGTGALFALVRVARRGKETPGRARFLRAQLAAWLLFAGFNRLYFGLRSPINAAIVTCLYTAATAISLRETLRMNDKKAALGFAPTLAWLALALPLALTQAAWNRDEFWNAGPFLA